VGTRSAGPARRRPVHNGAYHPAGTYLVEGGKRKWGGERERHYFGEGARNHFPVLKGPRQCLFVLLVEVMLVIGINFYDVRKGNLIWHWKGYIKAKC
jgi:hypothetical protein